MAKYFDDYLLVKTLIDYIKEGSLDIVSNDKTTQKQLNYISKLSKYGDLNE